MKTILITVMILMLSVTCAQAKRKSNIHIHKHITIQDKRTSAEKRVDRSDARRNRQMNQAYKQHNEQARDMRRFTNRILNDARTNKSSKRPKYKTRKFF